RHQPYRGSRYSHPVHHRIQTDDTEKPGWLSASKGGCPFTQLRQTHRPHEKRLLRRERTCFGSAVGGRIANCHPERSEGSASCGELQIPRFARDDKVWTAASSNALEIVRACSRRPGPIPA